MQVINFTHRPHPRHRHRHQHHHPLPHPANTQLAQNGKTYARTSGKNLILKPDRGEKGAA